MKQREPLTQNVKGIATDMQDPFMVIAVLTDTLRGELGDKCTPEISAIMDKITDACDQARQIVRAAYENATNDRGVLQ